MFRCDYGTPDDRIRIGGQCYLAGPVPCHVPGTVDVKRPLVRSPLEASLACRVGVPAVSLKQKLHVKGDPIRALGRGISPPVPDDFRWMTRHGQALRLHEKRREIPSGLFNNPNNQLGLQPLAMMDATTE